MIVIGKTSIIVTLMSVWPTMETVHNFAWILRTAITAPAVQDTKWLMRPVLVSLNLFAYRNTLGRAGNLVFLCIDINECQDDRHNCSQLCLNELGSFKCECSEGYLKDPLHPSSCKSIEGHASLLYFYQGSIRKLSLDHLKVNMF